MRKGKKTKKHQFVLRDNGKIQLVMWEDQVLLNLREWKKCGIRLKKRPETQRLYSLPEIKDMLKEGTAICNDKDIEKRLLEGIALFDSVSLTRTEVVKRQSKAKE